VEVDEPAATRLASGTEDTSNNSSGKAQMQQLLGCNQTCGDGKETAMARSSKLQQAAAVEHPVYGTPTGAAPTGSSKKKKANKEDHKQRKLGEFFAAARKQ
jgi:hypothetical protein